MNKFSQSFLGGLVFFIFGFFGTFFPEFITIKEWSAFMVFSGVIVMEFAWLSKPEKKKVKK